MQRHMIFFSTAVHWKKRRYLAQRAIKQPLMPSYPRVRDESATRVGRADIPSYDDLGVEVSWRKTPITRLNAYCSLFDGTLKADISLMKSKTVISTDDGLLALYLYVN